MDSNQKKILVIPALFPTSAKDNKGIFVWDYIKSVQSSYSIEVYNIRLFGDEAGVSVANEGGVTIHRVNLFRQTRVTKALKHFLYLVWYIKAVKYLKHFKGVDLIHVHGGLFLNGVLGLSASRRLKAPVVYSEHMGRFYEEYSNPVVRAVGKSIFKRFDGVLLVSNYLRRNVERRGFKPKQTFVVYNPVDTQQFLPGSNPVSGRLIFVGRFDSNRGPLRVLEAFKRAKATKHELSLVMIGSGTETKLAEAFIANNPELNNSITLMGYQNKTKINEQLQLSSALVSPSIVESFGISVAEAMACGVPVIVGKNTGPADFVDEKSGIQVNPQDIDEIAKAMIQITDTNTKYNSQYIRKIITDRFSLPVFGERLMGIYETIINTR